MFFVNNGCCSYALLIQLCTLECFVPSDCESKVKQKTSVDVELKPEQKEALIL